MPRRSRPAPPPREHWVLFTVTLLALAVLLLLHAIVIGGLVSHTPHLSSGYTKVPAAVRDGGPVVDVDHGTPQPRAAARGTVAITVDGGPDPQWTPKLLDLLDQHHVKATFFITGIQATRYPDLVGQIVRRGHEIGQNSGTRSDLRGTPSWRRHVELRATDLVLAYITGQRTSLFRPPFANTPRGVDNLSWELIRDEAADRRLTVLADVDSAAGTPNAAAARIAKETNQSTGHGVVVAFHDTGTADAAHTVKTLRLLLPTLTRDGRQVLPVAAAVHATNTTAPAPLLDKIAGAALVIGAAIAGVIAGVLPIFMVVATVLALLRTVVVLIATRIHVDRGRRNPPWPTDDPVTVIVPAYNEEVGIRATVESILTSDHAVRVIVVDDGSTDGTGDIARTMTSRSVRYIRQANAGKAAALNTGIAAAETELIVMVDGDTILEPGAVGALVAPMTDPAVGAVSGNAKVGNRGGLLGRWQHIEYVLGFNLDRRMYDVLQCMPTVPGAIGAFRRSAVIAAGSVPTNTLAEDTDLTMALERDGWRITYAEGAIAWTEAPATLGQLWKQRYRWCYGTLQAIWKHRRAFVERGIGGKLGRRGLPYLLAFQVALPVLAPIVDVAVLVGLVNGQGSYTFGIWLLFLGMQLVPAVIAFRLDHERLAPLFALPLQQFVYRQLMYLVVIQSVFTAIAGARLPWHKLERRGLSTDG